MKLKLIADWHKQKLRCHFCGTEKSVKYLGTVLDPVVDSKPIEVCICNRCVAVYNDKILEKE